MAKASGSASWRLGVARGGESVERLDPLSWGSQDIRRTAPMFGLTICLNCRFHAAAMLGVMPGMGKNGKEFGAGLNLLLAAPQNRLHIHEPER